MSKPSANENATISANKNELPVVDATVFLFSDSQQQRASCYYRGVPADVILLLTCAGIDDPDFGDMLIHAALSILENLEKQPSTDN